MNEAVFAGMCAVLGAFAESDMLRPDDERLCLERLVRLGHSASHQPGSEELSDQFYEALLEARAAAVRTVDFVASAAGRKQVDARPSGASHPSPSKRPRTAAVNSSFS